MREIELTQDYLKSILDYCPSTGEFRWKWRSDVADKYNRMLVGKVAGCREPRGYWYIKINQKMYPRHSLAWLYVNGRWPAKPLDHANRVRGDDRIDNLREASIRENRSNSGPHRTNKCGVKGALLVRGRWQARITSNGKQNYLGSFDTKEDAGLAYVRAAKRLYGEFAPDVC